MVAWGLLLESCLSPGDLLPVFWWSSGGRGGCCRPGRRGRRGCRGRLGGPDGSSGRGRHGRRGALSRSELEGMYDGIMCHLRISVSTAGRTMLT